jgi:hypothetical protein
LIAVEKPEELLNQVEVKCGDTIPVVRITTQREKSTIFGDFVNLLKEKREFLTHSSPLCPELRGHAEAEPQLRTEIAKNMVRIMQGVPTYKATLNEWKSFKFWDKYYKYDYKDLMDIALEAVNQNMGTSGPTTGNPAVVKVGFKR